MTGATAAVGLYTVEVSDKTTWVFVRVEGPDGGEGLGEATLNGRTGEVLGAFAAAIEAANAPADSFAARIDAARDTPRGIVGRAVASGLEQAVLAGEAARRGVPLHALFGGAVRREVPVYANINRGTLVRSPQSFADRAERAAAEGYPAVKLAPFDGVEPTDATDRAALVAAGLERVAAVAQRLGARCATGVDCHARFRADEVEGLLAAVAERGATWLEEPLAETAANRTAIAALRERAEARQVTLAGAENVADTDGLMPLLHERCYDVVMPDIVLAGGPSQALQLARLAAAKGTAVSPHNPCGPVMDMQSLHVASVLAEFHSLERQFQESPLYDEIVAVRAHPYVGGAIRVGDTPGLGLTLDLTHPAVQRVATHRLTLGPIDAEGKMVVR